MKTPSLLSLLTLLSLSLITTAPADEKDKKDQPAPAAETPKKPAEKAEPESTPSTVNVLLETSKGDILLELDAEKAPISTQNFLNYVKKGHYDGTVFHRVIPGFMVQGGGFTSDMQQKDTDAPIKNESKNGLRNSRGTIAMARTNIPDSATSQFFLNVVDNNNLDYPSFDGFGYAVFGKVVEGMDVVDAIVAVQTTSVGPHQNVPADPITIKKASVKAADEKKADAKADAKADEKAN
ncbi:MAG: peptidylprolyl isomerase [Verrucomicrobiales bacterium]|nr:peptidylprolyl isomerase [Verrucomicrobiales bacterium]